MKRLRFFLNLNKKKKKKNLCVECRTVKNIKKKIFFFWIMQIVHCFELQKKPVYSNVYVFFFISWVFFLISSFWRRIFGYYRLGQTTKCTLYLLMAQANRKRFFGSSYQILDFHRNNAQETILRYMYIYKPSSFRP